MQYKISVLAKANQELVEALEWYMEQQLGLDDEFIDQFEKDVATISNNPESYPIIKKGYRKAVMEKFPYVILYSVSKKKQIISIVSIFHTSRNRAKKFRK